MRASTRVPEPPVAPITNGADWATPTLATANAAEQYPSAQLPMSIKNGRAIVFPVWGEKHIALAADCIRESRLPDYPILLLTDETTVTKKLPAKIDIVRCQCRLSGKARKLELFASLPDQIETLMLIDADTRVLEDVSLGFEKA